MNASSSWSLWKDLAYQTESVFDRWVGGGDMKYADFHFETVTWNTVVLWLSESIIPTQNFVVTPPTEIKDWQTYILRVQSWDTPVNMGLAWWIINPHWTSTTLTPNAIDMFVFLAVWNILELQPEIVMWWGWSAEWWNIRWNIADQTDLQTALSLKADDNAVVHNTWNETVAGTKTFSTSPVVPSKTADATNTGTAIATEAQVYKKQDTLTQGTWISISSNTVSNTWVLSVNSNTWAINLKTINSTSLIWTGNITTPTTTVVNNLTSTSTTSALSANQWRILNWKITDLMALWKFLSLWNAATGQPMSFPYTTPYAYNTWDYFLVETVDTTTNYRPTGSSYTWTASSTVETDELEQGDVYIYDWSVWLLQSNHWKTVSFANIAGQPTDNTNLATALGQKQDNLTAWTWISIWTIYDYSAMQWPAPDGFHVPLNTEWQAVYDIWTALGGGSSDWTNFGIALKLPFAGCRAGTSSDVLSQGTSASYWSSTAYSANHAYSLDLDSAGLYPSYGHTRSHGFSVRCFKDSPTVPTSSWTKLYWTSIEAWWIFWNSTDWLISLSSDWSTWITIADKNLWATTVWNSGDTLSETNAWKYYQRWNNYGFPRTWTVTTSSTQVDASTYWPWNYYSSSTFITRSSSPYSWDTTDNRNLWWWETGVVTLENAITNTGVLSVNGQTWAVTVETPNIKVFEINQTSDAQDALDWFLAWNTPVLKYMSLWYYYLSIASTWALDFTNPLIWQWNFQWSLQITYSWTTVTNVQWSSYNIQSWIQNDTTWTTTTVTKIRAWTEAEYNALSTKSPNIIYHIY